MAVMAVDVEREILDLKEIVLENNKILRSLQRKSRITFFINMVKWIAIVAIALGFYTFFRPVINQLFETYNTIVESAKTISEIKDGVQGGVKNIIGS